MSQADVEKYDNARRNDWDKKEIDFEGFDGRKLTGFIYTYKV